MKEEETTRAPRCSGAGWGRGHFPLQVDVASLLQTTTLALPARKFITLCPLLSICQTLFLPHYLAFSHCYQLKVRRVGSVIKSWRREVEEDNSGFSFLPQAVESPCGTLNTQGTAGHCPLFYHCMLSGPTSWLWNDPHFLSAPSESEWSLT